MNRKLSYWPQREAGRQPQHICGCFANIGFTFLSIGFCGLFLLKGGGRPVTDWVLLPHHPLKQDGFRKFWACSVSGPLGSLFSLSVCLPSPLLSAPLRTGRGSTVLIFLSSSLFLSLGLLSPAACSSCSHVVGWFSQRFWQSCLFREKPQFSHPLSMDKTRGSCPATQQTALSQLSPGEKCQANPLLYPRKKIWFGARLQVSLKE